MQVAEKWFVCKACQANGRCPGVVGATKVGNITGLTVLSKNAFSGNYAAGSVALCGTTKDKARASCRAELSRAVAKFQDFQRVCMRPELGTFGDLVDAFVKAGGDRRKVVQAPFLPPPAKAHNV